MKAILTEIMYNRFSAIVEEASAVAYRTAHTTFVKQTQDFQVALVSPRGETFICPKLTGTAQYSSHTLPGFVGHFNPAELQPGDGPVLLYVGRMAGNKRIDVLINNAGIAGPTGGVETLSLADWERTLAVNLTGQFLCIRQAVPRLRKGNGPSIINLASAAGHLGMPRRAPYSASKWGVVGLTKTLAIELGRDGIRVNAILPGAVDGPRIRAVIAAKAAGQDLNAVYRSTMAALTPDFVLRRGVLGFDHTLTSLTRQSFARPDSIAVQSSGRRIATLHTAAPSAPKC